MYPYTLQENGEIERFWVMERTITSTMISQIMESLSSDGQSEQEKWRNGKS
jgi:hypothetical protein